MIPTLPLAPRNRLAELILAALGSASAREELARLEDGEVGALAGWLAPDERRFAGLLAARARRARNALGARPPRPIGASRAEALEDAATLWNAGLYFEVHELLEPFWRAAAGEAREALQGVIQGAVGYQHLANGNLAGARTLLAEGGARLRGRALDGRVLDDLARAFESSAVRVENFDWSSVPRFPRVMRD